METGLLAYCIGALAAFSCASCTVYGTAAVLRHRVASTDAMRRDGRAGFVDALIAWRLRKGYAWARPLAQVLLNSERITQVIRRALVYVELRGQYATPESLASVFLHGIVCIGVLTGIASGSLLVAIALAACVVAGAVVVVNTAYDKRKDAIRESVPQALEAMQSCFATGFTLLQTFQQVAHDIGGPLGDLFARSAHILETGGTADQALKVLKDESDASELAFVAVALDVQHQSGGALRQVLQAAIDTVKGELALRSALRVQTAQAKLSARVVSVMPLILVAAFSLASPDYLLPFFSSIPGMGLLALAVVMQLAGIALVRRALSVQGVTR